MTGRKLYALGLLALISFCGAVLEAVLTGRVEPFGKFDLVESLLSLVPLYWWYYLDKEQRRFSTGVVQNLAVVAVAVLGLPVYFIRSRGWKQGGIATALALAFWAVLVGLGLLGEKLGLWLAG
jgi:FtsH-binding integral membrane protein